MRDKPFKIAITGKGGSGKTVITSLLTRIISDEYNIKLLLIDADPTYPHLTKMVNLAPKQTIEQIRLNLIKKFSKNAKNGKDYAENLNLAVYDNISESSKFALFSLGHPEGEGCFCPSNTLLRNVLREISSDFELVLIDAEAGLEQIQRKVLDSIDLLFIVSDTSMRSFETALAIREYGLKHTACKSTFLVFNRVKSEINRILESNDVANFDFFYQIPEDPHILSVDINGESIFELPNNSPSLLATSAMVKLYLSNLL